MKAKITKVHPLKTSRTEKSFIRIEFELENGDWAKTDIVPAYRNYRNWKPFIDAMNRPPTAFVFVDGIKLRRKGEVDGDSPVRSGTPFQIIKAQGKKSTQDTLL